MKNILNVFFAGFFSLSIAQPIPVNVGWLPQGEVISNLSAYGFSGILNDVSNIGGLNPAAISLYKNMSIGLSYQYDTEIDEAWSAGIGHKREFSLIPQSASIVYPYENFRFGLSLNQKYNSNIEFGLIPVTSLEEPDGTGKFTQPIYKTKVMNYSFSVSYTISKFTDNSELSFGSRLSLSTLIEKQELQDVKIDETVTSSGFELGIMFLHEYSESANLILGLNYSSELNFSEIVKYQQQNGRKIDDTPGTGSGRFVLVQTHFNLNANLPAKLQLDVATQLSNRSKLTANFTNVFWSNISNSLKDRLEYSFGYIYKWNNMFESSIGFFTTEKCYKNDVADSNNYLSAIYLSAGFIISFEYLELNLAIADSHTFSDDWRKQTIFKAGATYNF